MEGKPFFEGAVKHLSSGPVMVMVWEAGGVIQMALKMLGATFGYNAQGGTIRGISAVRGVITSFTPRIRRNRRSLKSGCILMRPRLWITGSPTRSGFTAGTIRFPCKMGAKGL